MIVKNLIAALREDDTVYVNDLGLFRKVFTRAHVEEKHVFPPRYSVLLDSEEDGSGYAFILFVSKSENIRIVDADLAIRRWVEKLWEELHNSRSVTVEGFGSFILKKNKLEFTAAPEIPELNVEFEGMDPIDIQKYPKQKHPERVEVMPPVVEEPVAISEPVPQPDQKPDSIVEPEPVDVPEPEPAPIIEPKQVVEPEPAPQPQLQPEPEPVIESEPVSEQEEIIEPKPIVEPEHICDPEPVIEPEPIVEPELITEPELGQTEVSEPETEEVPETIEEAEPAPKKHWGWIVFVVVLLLAIGVLGWFFQDNLLNFYHQKFDKQAVTDTTAVVEETPEPIVMDTVAKTDTIGFVEEEPVMEEPVPEVKPFDINNLEHINYEQGKYYLVHGSFSQEADCARHIRSHHFEPYSPKVLHQSGNSRMRVCLGVFNSEAESTQFATANGIKDAWTLK